MRNLLPSTSPPPTGEHERLSAPTDPLLTDREAAAILHVAVSTFRRYVAKRVVPPPVKLGGASRWPQSEILAVIEAAKAARDR